MITILKIVSYIGLGLTVVPSFLVYFGSISFESHKTLMLIGTVCWFVTAPFWINKKDQETEQA